MLAKALSREERDWDYVGEVLKAGLADHGTLLERIPDMPLDAQAQERVAKMLTGITVRLGLYGPVD